MSTATAFSAIREVIEARFTELPLAWANEPFTRPSDVDGLPSPFVRIRIISNAFEVTSIGAGAEPANRWTEAGQVWAYIFVATGSGSLAARTYGETFADAVRGLSIDDVGIEFRDVSFSEGDSADDDGAYWGLAVSVDWVRGI